LDAGRPYRFCAVAGGRSPKNGWPASPGLWKSGEDRSRGGQKLNGERRNQAAAEMAARRGDRSARRRLAPPMVLPKNRKTTTVFRSDSHLWRIQPPSRYGRPGTGATTRSIYQGYNRGEDPAIPIYLSRANACLPTRCDTGEHQGGKFFSAIGSRDIYRPHKESQHEQAASTNAHRNKGGAEISTKARKITFMFGHVCVRVL